MIWVLKPVKVIKGWGDVQQGFGIGHLLKQFVEGLQTFSTVLDSIYCVLLASPIDSFSRQPP